MHQLYELVPQEAELWCRPEATVRFGNPAERIIETAVELEADLIVLAVKPGTLPKVVTEIRDALGEQKILLSLAASVPIALIEKAG